MKALSWTLMLIGVACVVIALRLRLQALGIGGAALALVGELLPRHTTLPQLSAPPRPVARRVVDPAPKPVEKSA